MASLVMPSKETRYSLVNSDESSDAGHSTAPLRPNRTWSSRAIVLSIANIATFLATVGIAFWSHRQSSGLLNPELRQCSSFSPLYDRMDLDPQTKRMNGTFFAPDDASVARQMPNPEADEFWTELETTRIFPITRDELLKLGKDPTTAVKLEDEVWGLGDEMYASALDKFHLLHCLNSIRFVVYGDYYNQTMGDANKPKRHHEIHINHCMDLLYQQIICSNNMNLISLHWVEDQPGPFPDMSIDRQCINFDRMVEWRKHNTLDMDMWISDVMDKPPGHAEIPWTHDV